MLAKSLLMILSLTTVLRLDCAEADSLTNQLLGDEEGSSQKTGVSLAGVDGGIEEQKFCTGLDLDVHPDIAAEADKIVKRSQERHRLRVKANSSYVGSFFSAWPFSYFGSLFGEASNAKNSFIDMLAGASVSAPTELKNLSKYPSTSVYDQGPIGSCSANAMAFAIRYLTVRNSATPSDFSSANSSMLSIARTYQYFNSRYVDGVAKGDSTRVSKDCGATLPGAILAIDKYGACPESASSYVPLPLSAGIFGYKGWPYVTTSFAAQPDPESYRVALDQSSDGITADTGNPYAVISKKLSYTKLNTAAGSKDIQNCLAANCPVYFGAVVFPSIYTSGAKVNGVAAGKVKKGDGRVPMPASGEASIGGHAITIVGYGQYKASLGDSTNYYKFINSWNTTWGDNGFGYFPEAYVQNQAYNIGAYKIDLSK